MISKSQKVFPLKKVDKILEFFFLIENKIICYHFQMVIQYHLMILIMENQIRKNLII